MPQISRPQVVITQTREGEVLIKLVVELNLNVNGQLGGVVASEESVVQKSDETELMVPEFSPSTEKIEFGKYDK